MSHAPVQIVGAGLTGMSTAHHLGEGYEIHERSHRPGGHCITRSEDGFRFDITGHLLHLRDPKIRDWVGDLIGNQCDLIARKSRVFSHHRYTRYPYQANTRGLPEQVAYECLMGFLEARDHAGTAPPPQNFEEYCLQVFGKGFTDHFMRPYNEKLWGVPATEITAEWCSRFVPRPRLEDVIAGAVGLNGPELGYNTHFLYPKKGIQTLSDAIAEKLPIPVRFERDLQSIDYRNRTLRFADGDIPFQVLVSSMPLNRLVDLLDDAPEPVVEAGKKLRCNGLNYLDIALDVPCGQDLHWAYVPEKQYPFYRIGCYSNFSSHMAPPGKSCLYVELATREKIQCESILPQVASGLQDMGIIERPEDIRFARARHIEHAYVVFDHHYFRALEVIHPFLLKHNIISQGRYGAWNYSSMEDALLYGRSAAEEARKLL